MGGGSSMCKINNCNLKVYEDKGKCVLHCEKSKYDHRDNSLYNDFKNALIENIADQLNEYSSEEIALPYDALVNFFTEGIEKIVAGNREQFLINIKNITVIFNSIVFPDRKSRDSFDYVKVLEKLYEMQFLNCEFYVKWMELEERKCFFNECTFYDWWSLRNYKLLEKSGYAIYERCIFKKEVSTTVSPDEILILDSSQFDNCKFNKLDLHDTTFNKPLFENTQDEANDIAYFSISNCTIKEKLVLNNQNISNFKLLDTVLENKFEFKNNEIDTFSIVNSNFEGLVDLYGSKFNIFAIVKSIFEKFVGFEDCVFGMEKEFKNQEYIAQFRYATFLDFINFRGAKFNSGLDMANANLKEYPNFLGVNIDANNTNKETFRIVKHSFDKVGNTIEANKYYVYEMDKEMKDTNGFNYPSKKIALLFSHNISHHGQSLIMPLIWIFVLGIAHHFVNDWLDNTTIYDIFPNYSVNHDAIKSLINNINGFAKNILPFKRFLPAGKEFISLLFLIGYSTLIYHFIVAVKRTTKR